MEEKKSNARCVPLIVGLSLIVLGVVLFVCGCVMFVSSTFETSEIFQKIALVVAGLLLGCVGLVFLIVAIIKSYSIEDGAKLVVKTKNAFDRFNNTLKENGVVDLYQVGNKVKKSLAKSVKCEYCGFKSQKDTTRCPSCGAKLD